MPGLDGTGPMGMGPITGGGRGFCSPWGIGAFTRAYGVPRWRTYRRWRWIAPRATPFAAPQASREQEISFLRAQAEAIKAELGAIEARIKELTKETK